MEDIKSRRTVISWFIMLGGWAFLGINAYIAAIVCFTISLIISLFNIIDTND
jgi:hypothetical protein